MLKRKQIALFLAGYIALRLFSYFLSPETPLYAANPINTVVSIIILLTTAYLLYKKDERGWYIVALEMILGGSGGFLAIGNISLRTCLHGASLLIYGSQKIMDIKYWILKNNKKISNIQFPIFLLIIWAVFSGIHGYLNGHNIQLVIADTIPYLFLLYYFPLRELLKSEKFKQIAFNALMGTIIGNFLLIIITFIGYSSGVLVLQDSYYHWYRDIALGKITELPFHFYRLVVNEHLLLVPVLLYFIYSFIARRHPLLGKEGRRVVCRPLALPREVSPTADNGEPSPACEGRPSLVRRGCQNVAHLITALLLVVLSLNLTRIYLVALVVGLLCLFTRANWKRWLTISIFSFLFFIFSFSTIHFAASRGQSLGWEIFGVRLQSIVSPKIEESSLSRMLILPKIIEKIKQNPLLGNGFGDAVTVYSPIFKQEVTTPHFDWGYLEIIAEMGIIGIIIWLFNIGYLILIIKQNPGQTKKFYFASVSALLIINLTSPALFHVFGIIWLTILLSTNISLVNYDTQIRKN